MTSRMPVICNACTRFNSRLGACKAFPKGIPDDIVIFGRDHRTSVLGDDGIVFEQGQSEDQLRAFKHWNRFNEAG